MVLVAHHLEVNGILLGIGASRQCRREVLAIRSILHLATLHCAGSNQSLSLSVIHQVGLSLRCRHRDVGLLDGKLRSLGAGVVAFTSGGHLSCTGIHVVSISQCIVSAFHKNRLAVLHSNSRLLLSAVVHILCWIKSQVK